MHLEMGIVSPETAGGTRHAACPHYPRFERKKGETVLEMEN
jgi:hypothetical protein